MDQTNQHQVHELYSSLSTGPMFASTKLCSSSLSQQVHQSSSEESSGINLWLTNHYDVTREQNKKEMKNTKCVLQRVHLPGVQKSHMWVSLQQIVRSFVQQGAGVDFKLSFPLCNACHPSRCRLAHQLAAFPISSINHENLAYLSFQLIAPGCVVG